MPGRGDGEVFGDALDEAEDDRVQDRHSEVAPLPPSCLLYTSDAADEP